MKVSSGQDLITTGEAARHLGSSRQHVVDLCERGELSCRRTPVHRRLLRSEVDALARTRKGLTREEVRSLWLNRAVAAHLARDPERVLRRARKNLARFAEIHARGSVAPWLTRWELVLDQGPEAVMEVLTSTAPDAAELRQNSPFPGVLAQKERRDVLESFARYWSRSAK
jgi:excisionase family DNA binding protein